MLTTGGSILNVATVFASVFFDVESNVIVFGWKSLEALGNLEMFLLAVFSDTLLNFIISFEGFYTKQENSSEQGSFSVIHF